MIRRLQLIKKPSIDFSQKKLTKLFFKHPTKNVETTDAFYNSVASFFFPTECLLKVFHYLENDIVSLHSCLLVNRLWCKVAVHFLWAEPFAHDPISISIVTVLLSCLENSKKLKLETILQRVPEIQSKPIFQYDKLIKQISISYFYCAVKKWVEHTQKLKSSYAITIGNSMSRGDFSHIDEGFSKFMANQKNLKDFRLLASHKFPSETLSSFATRADSLVSVEICGINFPKMYSAEPTLEGLALCKNLEDLAMVHCVSLSERDLMPLRNASFPRLRRIKFVACFMGYDHVMVNLIKNNPTHLQEIYYIRQMTTCIPITQESKSNSDLSIIEAVSRYSPQVIVLGVPLTVDQIPCLVEILTSPKCQIRSLSICEGESNSISIAVNEIWPTLGRTMPKTLLHLNIWTQINNTAMKRFFHNMKYRDRLKTLYIKQWAKRIDDGSVPDALREYFRDKIRSSEASKFFRHVI
ncbi:10978_t:CDS:2 [Gigaspora margarita]|uniref:10978_t:CDS:1 n=1 Tax=Gigaspora margarita TaxID=4874 RepID=A0ABN7UP82_GIGMA|nr:10978_t:CDS:2 [Gigaspora margarita]